MASMTKRLTISAGIIGIAAGLAAGPATTASAATQTAPAKATSHSVAQAGSSTVVKTVAKERSWQKWGKWMKIGVHNRCRTYVDATTKGSKILISGAIFCKYPNGVAMTLSSVPGGAKSRYCSARVMKDAGFCYKQRWVNNPRGKQTFRAATTGNCWGEQLPYANVVFRI